MFGPRKIAGLTPSILEQDLQPQSFSGLTPFWCTLAKLCCRPVNHHFDETRWEAFEADKLVGILWGNLHQVVASVWVNLNGVIPACRLIQDLPDRTHIRFYTLRRIKLAEY